MGTPADFTNAAAGIRFGRCSPGRGASRPWAVGISLRYRSKLCVISPNVLVILVSTSDK